VKFLNTLAKLFLSCAYRDKITLSVKIIISTDKGFRDINFCDFSIVLLGEIIFVLNIALRLLQFPFQSIIQEYLCNDKLLRLKCLI